ncbi:MAG: hypothetical protein ASARMPREDX12_008655 [Alectoria sarmentosa]|nr:MAG: hypothetical protein ASARMPRED_004681 [Alectoria sarmentosa]CAD6594336.1 MAG: hypothetical protein ASARMPREDX12_008655 [Alectoria sarmentosa]
MSTPDPPASSGPLALKLRGSKRGACDRCRGQKLRCLRKDQSGSQDTLQAKCVRCFKAGAICSYGTPKRAARSPASNAGSPHERRENGGENLRKDEMASRPTVNTSGQTVLFYSTTDGGQDPCVTGSRGSGHLLGEYTADQESEGETENTTSVHALSPLSMHDTSTIMAGVNLDFPAFSASSTATLPWTDETMPPFPNNDGRDASSLEPFASKYSWPFHHYQAQSMDILIPTSSPNNDEQSRDVGVNAYGVPAQTCLPNAQISGALDEAMDLDFPSRSAHTAPFNLTKGLGAPRGRPRDRHRERTQVPKSSSMSSIPQSTLFKDLDENDAGIKFKKSSLSISEIQHRRMQELSELAMDLYAKLAANDAENHQHTSVATATTFRDQLVGSVLKSSSTFLTLLISFSAPATSFSPFPPPPTPSTNHNHSTCSPSDSGASPLASTLDDDDLIMDESLQATNRPLPAASSDDSKPPPPIDMTTVLQLLTCYIRIIHLHSAMYARILDYMLAFPPHKTQHVDSVPPVFPGMQVGGVSLNRFGTFQVKLLLQISVHVLGEIESSLGLPKEYRVGKRKGGGTGVLGANVSGGFVQSLMKEGAWRGKKVESVREQLGNLKRVLKEAIEFE